MRVGEGEDEAFCMVLVVVGCAVPWKNAVSTKEMAIPGSDDGEGGTCVVAMLVEVGCCKSISALPLVFPLLFLFFFLFYYFFLFVLGAVHTQLPCISAGIFDWESIPSA